MAKKHFIYLLIIAFGFNACEKVVDLDLRTIEPRLVIDASLSESNTSPSGGCYAILTKTQDFNSDEIPQPIGGATITLTDNVAKITVPLQFENESGIYRTHMSIVSGRSYTMAVEYEGETYTATETVPHAVSIDSLYMIRIKMGKEDDPFMMPTIIFNDPEGERNYYCSVLYVNDKRMRSVYLQDDQYKDGKPFPWVMPFDSSDNNDKELKVGDNIKVEMSSLAYGSYYYLQTLYPVAAGGGVNPISNFSGGVLGFLKAHAYSSIEKEITESDIVDK